MRNIPQERGLARETDGGGSWDRDTAGNNPAAVSESYHADNADAGKIGGLDWGSRSSAKPSKRTGAQSGWRTDMAREGDSTSPCRATKTPRGAEWPRGVLENSFGRELAGGLLLFAGLLLLALLFLFLLLFLCGEGRVHGSKDQCRAEHEGHELLHFVAISCAVSLTNKSSSLTASQADMNRSLRGH